MIQKRTRLAMAFWMSRMLVKSWVCLIVISGVVSICPKRAILESDHGNITISDSDYESNIYCQWLIRGPGKVINIQFTQFVTECNFDYLYIYDGDSPSDKMLASLSGTTLPDKIVATSGMALVVFYSDLNFKPDNAIVDLLYKLTDCHQGCARCSNSNCLCGDNLKGVDCSIPMCGNPLHCNDQNGTCIRHDTLGEYYCNCSTNYIGYDCSTQLDGSGLEQSQWSTLIPRGTDISRSLTGHSSSWHEATDSLYVFGGWDLNSVIDRLEKIDLHTGLREIISGVGERPDAVYNHRSVIVDDCIYISGGRNMTHETNQFFRYCINNNQWTRLADMPVQVSSHSLTLANKSLYSIGGLVVGREFISDVYRYDITQSEPGLWENVVSRSGKESDARTAGHTTVYHADTNSLYVFGGMGVYLSRFARHEYSLFAFHLNTNVWSKVHYGGSSQAIAPPMAFHTADIIADYMFVYGGKKASSGFPPSTCINNEVYAYHFTCGMWVDTTTILGSDSAHPDGKGRYGHSSQVTSGGIVIIHGGYRGTILDDVWAFTPSRYLTQSLNDSQAVDARCQTYSAQGICTSDPSCFWCGAPPVIPPCASLTRFQDCNENKRSVVCPGLCAGLKDCTACVSFNNTQVFPGTTDSCVWSARTSTCQPFRQPLSTFSFNWWEGEPEISSTLLECQSVDNVAGGVRYSVHQAPTQIDNPDRVYHLAGTHIKYSITSASSGTSFSSTKFKLHAKTWRNSFRIRIVQQEARTNLSMSSPQQTHVSNTWNQQPQYTTYLNINQDLSTNTTYDVAMTSWRDHTIAGISTLSYGILWNAENAGLYSQPPLNFLQPYSSEGLDCSTYTTCLSCQLDVSCGWCPTTSTCYYRSEARSESECGGVNPSQLLITEPGMCTNCTEQITCSTCLSMSSCEWLTSDLRCQRRYLSDNHVIRNASTCPAECHMRENCSTCLREQDDCIWCENTQSCSQFSTYHILASYGQCTGWIENFLNKSLRDKCLGCQAHTTCSDCISDINCGWCGNDFYPVIGSCMQGDYSTGSTCSAELNFLINVTHALLGANISAEVLNATNAEEMATNASFHYHSCPDAEECFLGVDECHENATCVNTNTSYECNCNQGFEGDGINFCNVTCFHPCGNGECSGAPDYECRCYLGWAGVTCDTDCGCYNHSTCTNGTGICDRCQDNTYGTHCEFCAPGSYGNATYSPGCQPCQCNEHGIEELGHCDTETGVCFCQDGYMGDKCESCSSLLIGDPRDGGYCYEYSLNRRLMLNVTGEKGFTSVGKFQSVAFAQWIISPYPNIESVHNTSTTISIVMDGVKINCSQGAVYIYDGIYLDIVDRLGYIASYCGTEIPAALDTSLITSGFATVVYIGNSTDGSFFKAHYIINECPESCIGDRVCVAGDCVCIAGKGGVNCDLDLCFNDTTCSNHGVCDQVTETCLCDEAYQGPDCSTASVITTSNIVNGELLNSGPPPRESQTVSNCGLHGMVMFGGFSSIHGPLNDLWMFDGDYWTMLNSTGVLPPARYLHAAFCHGGVLYIHGGLTINETLSDLWSFNLVSNTWSLKLGLTGSMAGHTLTYIGASQAVTIGGFSSTTDWVNNTHTYDLMSNIWSINPATGSVPAGLMMHTTLYHPDSLTLYIYGGIRYYIDSYFPSSDIYFYALESHIFYLRPRPIVPENLPGRFLHSAVIQDDLMIVMGGMKTQALENPTTYIYSLACDTWHSITELIPSAHSRVRGQSSIYNNSKMYTFSSTLFAMNVDVVSLPDDHCSLYTGESVTCLGNRGCNVCNETGEEICYSPRHGTPSQCIVNGTVVVIENTGKCDHTIVNERTCKDYSDCVQCLTHWPFHGRQTQKCKWCSYCSVGMCIDIDKDCAQENNCKRTQDEKRTANDCVELRCRSPTCQQCSTESQDANGCIWTRNFMRSSELSRQVNLVPFHNYNCVTGLLLNLSSITVWTSPPHRCPAPCQTRTSCDSCLDSDGGSGGPAACYWSGSLQQCLPPSLIPLMCTTGICSPLLLSGNASMCPAACSFHDECSKCLAQAGCGWCSYAEGDGVCTEGNSALPAAGSCPAQNSSEILIIPPSWHFLTCPPENECNNTRHTCDLAIQDCVDLHEGYDCVCKTGYKLQGEICVPHCSQGCDQGECVKPDECQCHFSWVGDSCAVPCQCNGHSECLINDTSNCLECHNNTMGDQCAQCDKLFVGNATNGGQCVSCYSVCNEHTPICMTKESYQTILDDESLVDTYPDWVKHGPVKPSDVICYNCGNNTQGVKCDSCKSGTFRLAGKRPLTDACNLCQCNGHSDRCSPTTGVCENCSNNTISPTCVGGISNGKECYTVQCSQCIDDSYLGSPTNGNQCYLKAPSDYNACLTRTDIFSTPAVVERCTTDRVESIPLSQDFQRTHGYDLSCACAHAVPLPRNQAVLYAILPRFLNVDIRVTLNLEELAEVDLYVAKTMDFLTVTWNPVTLSHEVAVNDYVTVPRSTDRRKRDGSRQDISTNSGDFLKYRNRRSFTNQTTFVLDERDVSDYGSPDNFITMDLNRSVLVVTGVKNRLIVSIPYADHHLKTDKFYFIVVGRAAQNRGSLTFRQDQIKIELFVFFSVFFSCFFKFLSVCIIVWKLTQLYNQNRQRIQRQVELGQMASRPSASVLVRFSEVRSSEMALDELADFQLNPVCCEFTDDGIAVVNTVVFQLPGGGAAPNGAVFGSALMTMRISYQNRRAAPDRYRTVEKNNVATTQA